MRLAVATSRDYARFHVDDAELVRQLPPSGLTPIPCIWKDPHVEWSSFDAVLVRTIWDYWRHYGEFVSWLNRLESSGVRVFNPVPVLRWNADKRYLLDLERANVPVVPSRVAGKRTVAAEIADLGAAEVVVKPTISAGAWNTLKIRIDAADLGAVIEALPENREYLIQPFLPEVASAGEWSLMFFGGVFSHAVLKRPAAGDFRVQEKHGGMAEPADPPAAATSLARQVLAALPDRGLRGVLYARVDLVETSSGFRLMELELIEPQLFFGFAPDAARRLVRVLAMRLRGPADASAGVDF